MRKKEIIEYIVSGLCYLALFIYAIISKNKVGIIVLIILAIIIAAFLIVVSASSKVRNKRYQKFVQKIKQKEDKSIEDQLFLFCNQDKSYERIKEIIKSKKIKNISDVCPYIYKYKPMISYSYIGFSVNAEIKNNVLIYKISPSTKYRSFDKEPLFKNNVKEVSIKDYINIDNLIDDFVICMDSINKEIDSFIECNPIDKVFNGRVLQKTDLYINHIKRNGTPIVVSCSIMSIIFLSLFFVGLFDEENKGENIISYYTILVVTILFIVFFVACIFIGINNKKRYSLFQKDIKAHSLLKVDGTPTRVRLISDGYRSNHAHLYGVKVYINKCKYILPFSEFISKNLAKRIMFKKECKKQILKLECLNNSKIVINGEAPIAKLISVYLNYEFE